ncbi:MAG: MFS transporter [Bacilli bacterium]
MTNIKKYNIFILLSTIARNIVEVFSSVLLYKMGYSLKEILLFFSILYFVGAITSTLVIYLTRVINAKYILIFSSFVFSGSFYFMSIMEKSMSNLIIFSIIYGIGSYSYHSLRHYFAIKSMDKDKKKDIGSILIFSNIGLIIAPILVSYVTNKLSIVILAIIVIILSIFAIIPLFKLDIKDDNTEIKFERINKNKILFFVLEQAKVINLSLQPLYLYLFINSKIEYVGIFNAIMGISACIFIYFFVRKIDDDKYFKYLNILFCLLLLFKLNIKSKYLILIIGFFEGLGIKMFDVVSAENIYNIDKNTNVKGYLIIVEIIFCLVRSIFCLIGYFINDIKIILYLSIILIFMVGFVKRYNLQKM